MAIPNAKEHRAAVDHVLGAAREAADPRRAVAAWRGGSTLFPAVGGLVAVGKASIAMAAGFRESASKPPAFGLLVHPPGLAASAAVRQIGIDTLESDHPLPTERSVDAGQAALDVAERCRREGRPLVVLLSGGASALMCVPEAGLTVEDLRACTQALLRAGASIDELNAVRAHCDQVKGGRLAAAAAPSPVLALVISDVVGDRLDVIASGPTVPPTSSPSDALAVLAKYGLERACPAIAAHLRLRTASPPEPPDCSRSTFRVIASNATAVEAAAAAARGLGFDVAEAKGGVTGEARDAAFAFVGALRRARARSGGRPVAVIWGGETTVTVKGQGSGGRNLEAALAAAIAIDGDPGVAVATFASDGVDGTSDAAGAVVNGQTAAMARRAGADPEAYLANSNSQGFFERADPGALIKTGPTGTNVNDVWVGLA